MISEPISVLTPARNEEKKILLSIKSVLRQLGEADELIVYDDASSDKTPAIVKGVGDKRITLIEGTKQIGTAMASNLLVENARHELVARLDADDYCLPGRFDYQRKLIERHECDMLFGSALLKRGSLIVPQIPRSLDSEQIYRLLPFGNPLVNSTLMTRKSLIQELGGCPEGFGGEDYSLFLRAAIANKNMLLKSRYVVIREVGLRNEPKEARQRPWTKNLENEKIDLLRKNIRSNQGRFPSSIESLADEDVTEFLRETRASASIPRKLVNRFFGES